MSEISTKSQNNKTTSKKDQKKPLKDNKKDDKGEKKVYKLPRATFYESDKTILL
jgi:hypothetical protein